jgi:Aspartokinases
MIVQKFGGTSVKDANMIKIVSNIIKSNVKNEPKVVVSALEGVTDYLKNLANIAFFSNDYKEVKIAMDNLKERHLKVINELQVEDNILEKDFAELENVLKGIFYLKELNQKYWIRSCPLVKFFQLK